MGLSKDEKIYRRLNKCLKDANIYAFAGMKVYKDDSIHEQNIVLLALALFDAGYGEESEV